jgi:hypothetical protein
MTAGIVIICILFAALVIGWTYLIWKDWDIIKHDLQQLWR